MTPALLGGLVLLGAGFVLARRAVRPFGLSPAHQSPYFKPARAFAAALVFLGTAVAGFWIIVRESLVVGAGIAAIVVALQLFTRVSGTDGATKRAMTSSYRRYRETLTAAEDSEVLFRTLKSRYPRWPENDLRAMVSAYPNIDPLTSAVIAREKHRLTADQIVAMAPSLSTAAARQDGSDARQG